VINVRSVEVETTDQDPLNDSVIETETDLDHLSVVIKTIGRTTIDDMIVRHLLVDRVITNDEMSEKRNLMTLEIFIHVT